MQKKILVTPLNWGLGHATRTMPLIDELILQGIEPVLACDGIVLQFLSQEYPDLEMLELPKQNIRYSKHDSKLSFSLNAALQSRNYLKTLNSTYLKIQDIVESLDISAVISDHRFGCMSPELPSAIISHQLKIKSQFFSKLATKFNQNQLRKFDEIWVPDIEGKHSLAGELSQVNLPNRTYIGPLSRFVKKANVKRAKLTILLSGPEPQRGKLERLLISELKANFEHIKSHFTEIVFVRGSNNKLAPVFPEIKIIDLANTAVLQELLNESKLVIARTGYSTIMDLKKLDLPALLIPTPGQPEQEYLGSYLTNEFTIQKQNALDLSELDKITSNVPFDYDNANLKLTIERFIKRC